MTEQTAAHTPGEWEVEENGFDVRRRLTQTPIMMSSALMTETEARANARLIAATPKLKEALAAMLDFWGGYECPEVDAAIAVMQEIGEDRWSMQAQMEASRAEGRTEPKAGE
jgi:hypothetical protein